MKPLQDTQARSIDLSIDLVVETPHMLKTFMAENFQSRKTYRPSRAMRVCMHLLTHIKDGELDLILPCGTSLRYGQPNATKRAVLRVHNDRMARRFLTGGRLGFCESYLDGDWSSPDIACFFALILRNTHAMRESLNGKSWIRILSNLKHMLQPNTKRGSKKNIYRHYDISNDFYAAWLDPSMTYSSALFQSEDENLESAQHNKYAEMVRRLDLKPEHHVLEIGCGWGGFAEYAARHVGCKITAITISQAQYDYATARIEKSGLQDRVDIRLQDYRDVTERFDRIASIEMFEAVGEAYWPVYFKNLKRSLKPMGRACLQIITIRDEDFQEYRKSADYIQRYIFPGGMLPSMEALEHHIDKADLKRGDVLNFGQDYGRTLELWNEAFQNAWPDLNAPGMDTRFKRLWEQYLCYCQAGFETGSIDVIQVNITHKN